MFILKQQFPSTHYEEEEECSLMEETLKVVWDAFSTLNYAAFVTSTIVLLA
jgi:hypothetical protein